MITLRYVGPHDAVDVPILTTGQVVTVARHKSADLPDAVAEGLLEQGREHWRKGTPKPPRRSKRGRS